MASMSILGVATTLAAALTFGHAAECKTNTSGVGMVQKLSSVSSTKVEEIGDNGALDTSRHVPMISHLNFPLRDAQLATALLQGKLAAHLLASTGTFVEVDMPIPAQTKVEAAHIKEDHCASCSLLHKHAAHLPATKKPVVLCASSFPFLEGVYACTGVEKDLTENVLEEISCTVFQGFSLLGGETERIIYAHVVPDDKLDKDEVSSQIARVAFLAGPEAVTFVPSAFYASSKVAFSKIVGNDEAAHADGVRIFESLQFGGAFMTGGFSLQKNTYKTWRATANVKSALLPHYKTEGLVAKHDK